MWSLLRPSIQESELTAKEAELADLRETVAGLEPRMRRATEEAAALRAQLASREGRATQVTEELRAGRHWRCMGAAGTCWYRVMSLAVLISGHFFQRQVAGFGKG